MWNGFGVRFARLGALALAGGALAGCGREAGSPVLQGEEPPARALGDDAGSVAEGPRWTPAASMQLLRVRHTATLLLDGKLLIAGAGEPDGSTPPESELYDPEVDGWGSLSAMPTSLALSATMLRDGTVLLLASSTQIYHPANNQWSTAPAMKTIRAENSATLLPDGKVLLAGGWNAGISDTHALASAEAYDPSTQTFSDTSSMIEPRRDHTATLLQTGQVLVAGGAVAYIGDVTGDAERYDPERGIWSLAATAPHPRAAATAVLLNDGRVLVAGGYDAWNLGPSDRVSEVDMYDPQRNTWSSAGALRDPRAYHAAALLQDGRVLVTGGLGVGGVLSSAEIYDPEANAWSPAGQMSTPRYNHTMTVLGNGRVLVAGGATFSGSSPPGTQSTEYARDLGAACEASDQCLSGRCLDGLCCKSAGECAKRCRAIADCIPPQVCGGSNRCVIPPPNEDHSGCRAASRPAAGGEAGWLGAVTATLAALAGARGRRRSRGR